MRNLALGCAALVVISTVISVTLWRELRTERQLTAQIRSQLAQSGSIVASAAPALPQPGAAAGPAADAGAGAATAGQQAPVAASPTPPPPPVPVLGNAIFNRQELLNDPEYRRAALMQARLNMDQNYPGLVEALALTPEQGDKLMDLLAELQLERTANPIRITADGQVDPAAMEEMTRRNQQLQQRQDQQITDLLGSAGLQQFRAYEETRSPRMQAQNVRRMMESAGMSLSDAQMRPLTEVYIAEQQRQREEIQAALRQFPAAAGSDRIQQIEERNLQLQEERNRRLLEVARGHLTAPQYERFEATLEQQLVMTRASSRMMRQQREAQERAQQSQGAGPVEGGSTPLFMVSP